jgi:hypothetical protein
MAMSEPSVAWISMAISGLRNIGEPSTWFWKWQPSSRILRILASEKTWNPPLSVRPVHEAVQAARAADDVHAGSDPEVVGVAQDDLGFQLPKFVRMDTLDGALGAHRHENGRLHHPVRGVQTPPAGAGLGIGGQQLKHCAGAKGREYHADRRICPCRDRAGNASFS